MAEMKSPAEMSDAEFREFALAVRSGTIFGTWNLAPQDMRLLPSIFMTLGFMTSEQHEELISSGVVHFYEELSKAGPRGINGYPCFFSHRVLKRPEADRLQAELDRLEAFINAPAGS